MLRGRFFVKLRSLSFHLCGISRLHETSYQSRLKKGIRIDYDFPKVLVYNFFFSRLFCRYRSQILVILTKCVSISNVFSWKASLNLEVCKAEFNTNLLKIMILYWSLPEMSFVFIDH